MHFQDNIELPDKTSISESISFPHSQDRLPSSHHLAQRPMMLHFHFMSSALCCCTQLFLFSLEMCQHHSVSSVSFAFTEHECKGLLNSLPLHACIFKAKLNCQIQRPSLKKTPPIYMGKNIFFLYELIFTPFLLHSLHVPPSQVRSSKLAFRNLHPSTI